MLSRNPMVDTEFLALHLDKYLLLGEMKICKLFLARMSFLHHWKGSHRNTDLTQSSGGAHNDTSQVGQSTWQGARASMLFLYSFCANTGREVSMAQKTVTTAAESLQPRR